VARHSEQSSTARIKPAMTPRQFPFFSKDNKNEIHITKHRVLHDVYTVLSQMAEGNLASIKNGYQRTIRNCDRKNEDLQRVCVLC
jgi:hypothetical protein